MKRYRLFDLKDTGGHFLGGIMGSSRLHHGGLHFYDPGEYSHPEGRHFHEHSKEVFVCLQGRARLLVDGVEYEMRMGDIALIEPGEEHHLLADSEDPIVNLWLHVE